MINKNLINSINKKEENYTLLWVILFFLFVCLYIYFNNHNSLSKIKEKYVYTIETVRDYSPSRTGKILYYTYFFKEKAYTGGYKFYEKDEKFAIGNRFLVILNPDEPETKFFIPYQIPDNIEAPPEGWKELPLDITDNEVIRYLEKKF